MLDDLVNWAQQRFEESWAALAEADKRKNSIVSTLADETLRETLHPLFYDVGAITSPPPPLEHFNNAFIQNEAFMKKEYVFMTRPQDKRTKLASNSSTLVYKLFVCLTYYTNYASHYKYPM